MSESLMRCTIKKSASVTKRLLWISVRLALVGVAIAGAFVISRLILDTVYSTLKWMVEGMVSAPIGILQNVLFVLTTIPWWIYPLVSIPLVVVGYSLCWCVSRELTESDMRSDTVHTVGGIYLAVAIILFIVTGVAALIAAEEQTDSIYSLTCLMLMFFEAILCIMGGVIIEGSNTYPITRLYKFCAFIPATYVHYRKQREI